MRIKIEFSMDNSAFEDNADELPEILKKIAEKVRIWTMENWDLSGVVMDSNGSRVGSWEITE